MSIAVAHLLKLEIDELKAKLAREERTSQRLTRMLQAVVERNKKLEAVAEAVKAMKKNLICDRLADGTMVHQWYTVAPCEYGEAVDEALAALDAPAAHDGDGDAD